MTAILALVLSLLAPRARADEPCQSTAERTWGQGTVDLSVGYVDQPPLAWNAHDNPHDPVGIGVDVLNLLAGRNGWHLKFDRHDRDEIAEAVTDCKVDVAIGGPLSGTDERLDETIPYFRSVAALLRRERSGHAPDAGELLPPCPVGPGLWARRGLRSLLFGTLALALLALLVNLVNLRIPRIGGGLPDRLRLVALNPDLVGPAGAWRWLSSTWAGRVLAVGWLAIGVGIALASTPADGRSGSPEEPAPVTAFGDPRAATQPIALGSSGQTFPCLDLQDCLDDLTHGGLSAVAADTETVCHLLPAEQANTLRFDDKLVWPREHAFLVRPSGPMRRLVNRALAQVAAADLTAISRTYGVPWTAPRLASHCPSDGQVVR